MNKFKEGDHVQVDNALSNYHQKCGRIVLYNTERDLYRASIYGGDLDENWFSPCELKILSFQRGFEEDFKRVAKWDEEKRHWTIGPWGLMALSIRNSERHFIELDQWLGKARELWEQERNKDDNQTGTPSDSE